MLSKAILPLLALLSNTAIADLMAAKSTIVSQPGATPAEVQAAQELQSHLQQITGASIPLRMNSAVDGPGSIVVGQGPLARKLFPDVRWESLGEEQTYIRSKGDVLLVAGGRPRGTLYAVYRLLSQQCGVRWWAPWAATIPQNPSLEFKELNWSESPAFEYRDTFWFHAFDGDWAARNFSNGFSARLEDKRGGKVEYQGFVHTYYGLVPPEKHFAEHPEWYSLIDGKRTFDNAQLCTTNPALRDLVVQRVREQLKANSKATIISVSQNDCFRPCQCPTCRALSEREGSDAALVLDLANYVGEKIEREFPKVAVDTLAYQWSRHPVKSMRPRPNVIVRLCSIECNFAFPLDAPQNAAFGDDIRGWSKLTNRLYVWDYCTNFAHYLAPQPDYFTVGPSIQFFANHGVKGVFEEGAYQSNGGDMAELKAWVIAQMLWDPKQDPMKLVEEFVRGYYGVAARFVLEYLHLMAERAKSWNLTFASPVTASFLDYSTMREAREILRSARIAASQSPEILWRLGQVEASIEYVWLSRWAEFQAQESSRFPIAPPALKAQTLSGWLDRMRSTGASGPPPKGWTPITHVNEGGLSPQDFANRIGR